MKKLDADYIRNLLAGNKKAIPANTITTKIEDRIKPTFSMSYKPDPLHLPQVGYPIQGDKGDIWAQWVKQGRTGAATLIERWG